MIKRAAVLLFGAGGFLGAAAVSATPYDDCVKNLAKTKVDNMLSDDDHAICLRQESARLLAEVQKVYAQMIKPTVHGIRVTACLKGEFETLTMPGWSIVIIIAVFLSLPHKEKASATHLFGNSV